MSIPAKLIPLRFLITIAHFIIILLCFYSVRQNVEASLPAIYSQSQYDSRELSLKACLWLSVIGFIIHLLDIMGGFSLFLTRFNALHIILHFVGCVLTCWFLVDEWRYQSLWYIWAFFNLLPTLIEIVTFSRIFCWKVEQYWLVFKWFVSISTIFQWYDGIWKFLGDGVLIL